MRSLGLATIFAALSGFVVLWIASWALGEDGYAQFQAYWGLFFALTGLIDGLTHETTRGVSAVREGAPAKKGSPWRVALVIGVIIVAVIALTSHWWMPQLVVDGTGASGLMAIGLLSYAFQAVIMGVLSGRKLWNQYASLVALDSGVRLVLSLVAWALGWGLTGFFIITILGALGWLVVLGLSPTAREHRVSPVDVNPRAFARRVGSAMLASGATASLITGFPVLLQATSTDADSTTGVTVSGIMMAVTLTRAPILVPVQRFQSALIVRFVNNRSSVLASLLQPVGLVLGVGVLGALAAWVLGPWILEVLFPAEFAVPGYLLAILTFASACTASLMITGAANLASEKHGSYVTGWVTATVVAFGVLSLPLPLEVAVCSALIIGPAAGGLVHVGALLRGRASVERV